VVINKTAVVMNKTAATSSKRAVDSSRDIADTILEIAATTTPIATFAEINAVTTIRIANNKMAPPTTINALLIPPRDLLTTVTRR
jgi:hypothetical protein